MVSPARLKRRSEEFAVSNLPDRSWPASRSHLWLAVAEGARYPLPSEAIDRQHAPEATLEIEFTGITEAQQISALAAFPGGRRFVLIKRS